MRITHWLDPDLPATKKFFGKLKDIFDCYGDDYQIKERLRPGSKNQNHREAAFFKTGGKDED